jgi:ribonuclease HII
MTLAWPDAAGVAGVDEAGRGPLAGPVVAAAVILPANGVLTGLDDSKKVPEHTRSTLAVQVMSQAVAYGLGWADAAEIDALNILEATLLAMRRALMGLACLPTLIQVDGNQAPALQGLFAGRTVPLVTVIGGDGREAAIAAASILAKTWRDRYMQHAELIYPGYGFAKHKGYGTVAHVDALRRQGVCQLHRRSFQPVRLALASSQASAP